MIRFIFLIGAPAGAAAGADEVPFTHVVIEEQGPQVLWGKGAGDLNGDGRVDLIAGGWKAGGLVWYQNPGWNKRVIDGASRVGTDIEVADIDRDGKLDVVAITSEGAVWYRNPDWKRHAITSDRLHDIELADIDRDGDVDVVGRNQGAFQGPGGKTLFFYVQNSPDAWSSLTRQIEDGEGLAVADLDRDGDPDVVVNGSWYENTGPVAGWPHHAYTSTWTHPHAFIAVGDVNGDRRADIVLSPSELKGSRFRISWLEAPAQPRRGPWKEHVIEPDIEAVVHFVGLADFNRDGRLDVAAASMEQGDDPDQVRIFLNLGKGARWKRQVLAETGSHSMRIVDLDGNGAMSLFGGNHAAAKVELWRNEIAR